MSSEDDIAGALTPVARAFSQRDIRFYVGGSVASSFHGASRSTMDVDVVADISLKDVSHLIDLLSGAYYISEPAIKSAVERKSCFNLIHLATSFKIDVFIFNDRPFDRNSMARRINGTIGNTTKLTVPFATPEDTITSKLEWYRLGNETSERQWQDVTLVLQLNSEKTDYKYLEHAAKSVGVADLLARLRNQLN